MGFLSRLFRGGPGSSTIASIQKVQQSFRELVEQNNRVLELIADAGEKLGGEFIFDRQYLRQLARDLAESVQGIVYNLNIITANRYPSLVAVQKSIGADILAALESSVRIPETDAVMSLDQVDESLSDAVGSKMARLGELHRRLGFEIPPGFVVTTCASDAFLRSPGIAAALHSGGPAPSRDSDWGARASEIQAAIRAASLPRDLHRTLRHAVARLARKTGCRAFSVRSSALGEDGERSFAGQYRTLLGVRPDDVPDAYREVLASLYSLQAMQYRRQVGLDPLAGHMAVGCLGMVCARSAGVLYTLDPLDSRRGVMIISAVRGLGRPVVDGSAAADRFEISRDPPHHLVRQTIAAKATMEVATPDGPVKCAELASDDGSAPSLDPEQLRILGSAALRIERYMKRAQDIEWAFDEEGRFILLQARPLRISAPSSSSSPDLTTLSSHVPVLLENRGEVACRGICCGRVRVVEQSEDLTDLEADVVLVARTSSPQLAAALPRACALVTDLGTATGHLATIARELRIPTIVNTKIATEVLRDAGEVTVDAEENIIYGGRLKELLDYQLLRSSSYEDQPEFRMLRKMLKSIAPLNLRDPKGADFSPASCRTYHDIIRFAHEKAVHRLIEGYSLGARRAGPQPYQLQIPVPIDLAVIDLGDGLCASAPARTVTLEEVRSAPLRAVLEGLATKGVWETGPADMDLGGFMASATRAASLSGPLAPRPERNLALITEAYLNLSLKLGYHYNIVDSYMTEVVNDNFIYFRFAGGVTEMARRTRRARLLEAILARYDFVVECRQDLVIGRIKKISFDNMALRLQMVGRLIGFTRQLDIHLKDDDMVQRCLARFMEGRYSCDA